MPIITSSHRELFRDSTTEDRLLLFRSLLDAKEDMTVEPKIDYQGQPVKLLDKNIAIRLIIERVNR